MKRKPPSAHHIAASHSRAKTAIKIMLIKILHWTCCIFPIKEGEPSEDSMPPPGGMGGNTSLIIKPSLIKGAGLGCFAERDYMEDEIICEYTGTVLTLIQKYRTKDWTYVLGLGRGDNGRKIWINPRIHLKVKARFINHHGEKAKRNVYRKYLPNEYKCLMIAERFINKGEELYCDYGAQYWKVVGKKPPYYS